ncbi:ALF repeat-containing protein [Streptomyces abikoensis]|uniref:ALF repeat-containing protein n=1 Tax=Streptomyces abikoensis TaxID=97398 RepID=UPI00340E1EFD
MAQAQKTEQLARDAEKAQLEADTQAGIEDAKARKKAEQDAFKQVNDARKQSGAVDDATKDLLAKAAAAGKDTKSAAQLGRKAAVNLLRSTGTWTRGASEAALSGTDSDVVNWVKTEYQRGRQLDNRDQAVFLAKVGGPTLAEAARKALESKDPGQVDKFLDEGAYDVQTEDYRVQVLKLMNGAGDAVKDAGSAAIKDGGVKALHAFLLSGYQDALEEDDRVRTLTIMNNGGAAVKAAAQVAMAGPASMQHDFVTRIQYKAAQMDADTATHVASVRALIAGAAQSAATANENAALASEVAARARDKAQEAGEWADKARASADEAKGYSAEAQKKAQEADASAASAASSAQKAKDAASTAQRASRQANYSANQATASAQRAAASAANAAASAASARQSATSAGRDAAAASAAASEAQGIAAAKYQAEQAAAAAQAAQEARENTAKGVDPADNPANDIALAAVAAPLPGEKGNEHETAQKWANYLGIVGTISGFVSGWLAKVPKGIPVVGQLSTIAAGVTKGISMAAGAGSAFLRFYATGALDDSLRSAGNSLNEYMHGHTGPGASPGARALGIVTRKTNEVVDSVKSGFRRLFD